MRETAVYVHIPFCDHKCIYCDFYSIITTDNIEPFLEIVKAEIKQQALLHSDGRKIISIFFGGGTPSLMNPEHLSDIIATVKRHFNVSDKVEITMESNPGTVDYKKLIDYRAAEINRLSIGVQSFNEDELKFLTRIHDSKTAHNAVLDASKAGYNNISIDLIFNLPGQTKNKWLHNLDIACALPLTHISAYSLILERGTVLNKMVIDGKVLLQDESHDADLYERTIDYLTGKDYYQYEVSNFAKLGYECIHNNCYWQYKDYFGFGPSAHSFINGQRWWNYSSLKMYISAFIKNGTAICSSEEPGNDEKLNEYIMLGLRSSGINLFKTDEIDNGWYPRNAAYLSVLLEHNFITQENNFIKLTKKGYAVCDEILLKLK